VLLGGDGSLHAAANSRSGARPELALIPGGRANNVARSLGVPLDLEAAARLAVEGRAHLLDAIAVNSPAGRYIAIEGISVGFHAIARTQYTATNSADMRAALRAGLGAVKGFRPLTIGLSLDGESRLARIGQMFVANMPLYGPGLRVAPASASDGLLDVVLIDRGLAGLVALIRRLRAGTHLGRKGVEHLRAHSIRIATGGRSPIIADTTNVGDTVELAVASHALAVVGATA
jgi:diacylglycerol kinase (ATP)